MKNFASHIKVRMYNVEGGGEECAEDCEWEEESDKWRKLNNEELLKLHASPYIVMKKSWNKS
jgi:hypothetical protein